MRNKERLSGRLPPEADLEVVEPVLLVKEADHGLEGVRPRKELEGYALVSPDLSRGSRTSSAPVREIHAPIPFEVLHSGH